MYYIFNAEHIQRLRQSSAALNIDLNYSDQEIKYYLKKLIEKNAFNGAIKILLAKNINSSDLIITMKEKNINLKIIKKALI
ncbi:aminotransferase class IV [Halanaerobium polyolivorans]|uniref:aminotransferase class IV n=1 Tax=Halanaerobium polyolivorans TaxID=2886943 RepID=UPI002107D073|nr:aminotransferase class IV [Halanaerobium polyolivorans]